MPSPSAVDTNRPQPIPAAAEEDDGFVHVDRPVDSIRLADVWLQQQRAERSKGLSDEEAQHHHEKNTTEKASSQEAHVTAIRLRWSGSSPTAAVSSTAAKNSSAFDQYHHDTNVLGGNTSDPIFDTRSESTTQFVNQQSFLRDMLKGFTAKHAVLNTISATSVNGSFAAGGGAEGGGDIIGDTTNAANKAVSNYAQNAAADPSTNNQGNNASTATTMINDQQWKRIWQQFRADIGRELFCIEGKRFTDADAAYSELMLLFKGFEGEWMAYQSMLGETEGQKVQASLVRKVSGMVWTVATWPAVAAVGITANIVTAPFRLLKLAYGGTNGSSAATAQPASPKPITANAANTAKDAPNDPLLCEGLARFVVLLSQQSVLAFPYELLHHQFAAGAENVYVGEIRTYPSCDDDEGENEAFTEAQREALEMASSMKVDVKRFDTVVKDVCNNNHSAADAPQPLPMPSPKPSADGIPCSTNPIAPPIPTVATFDAATIAAAENISGGDSSKAQKQVISAPYVLLTVKKEFRVFCLDDTEDHTLFHIVASISLDVTNASAPVKVTWSLKPAPIRRDRAVNPSANASGTDNTSTNASAPNVPHPIHGAAAVGCAPTYALNATSAVGPKTGGRGLDGATSSAPAPPTTSSSAAAQQQEATVRDGNAPPRLCDCLGGPMGFHRRDCTIGAQQIADNNAVRRLAAAMARR